MTRRSTRTHKVAGGGGGDGADPLVIFAETASWYFALLLLAFILLGTLKHHREFQRMDDDVVHPSSTSPWLFEGAAAMGAGKRPCDEIYVVGEGETLHTISDKCGDPFIVERNPHIHDPDDVFPGLVIRIVPDKTISGDHRR